MSTPKNQRLNQERTWPEQSSTTNNLFAPSVGHLGSGKWKVESDHEDRADWWVLLVTVW